MTKQELIDRAVDWYNYDKQQAIALPPVGAECEYTSQFFGTKKHYNGTCKVIAYYQNKVWVDVIGYNEFVISLDVIKFRPLDWNRKAEAEKREFVEKAVSLIRGGSSSLIAEILNDHEGIAAKLYDAGCRFTENKAP